MEASFSYIKFKSSFKFLPMWILYDNVRNFIANCWAQLVIGCPMFILTKKNSKCSKVVSRRGTKKPLKIFIC